jgi:hypothetical protein
MQKLTAILIIGLYACGGISNTSEDLSGGFVYSDMGGPYKTIYTGLPNQRNIVGTVEEYSYDKDFIVALQHPNLQVHRSSISSDLQVQKAKLFNSKASYGIKESDRTADSIILCDPYYQKIFSNEINYWIISHKWKKMYGPLTKEEYFQKRKELKVPDELKFEDENK